jgi:hypothetical protein
MCAAVRKWSHGPFPLVMLKLLEDALLEDLEDLE